MTTNSRKTLRSIAGTALALTGLLFAGACRHVPDETLVQGYQFGKADQWDNARPFIKAYLNLHPDDPGAHYLWGQCHLHGPAPVLEIARGEFALTIVLLERDGDTGALRGHIEPESMRVMAHREIARACFREVHANAGNGHAVTNLNRVMREALRVVERGLGIAPGDQELLDMRLELQRQLRVGNPKESAPTPKRPAPMVV